MGRGKSKGITFPGSTAKVITGPVNGKLRTAPGGVQKKKRKNKRKPTVAQDPYVRPGFNKSTREKIWQNAVNASPDGKVRDPLTGKVMNKNEPWEAGHLPDWEFRKHKAAAEQYGTAIYPRSQFVKDYNNADHAQPELKSSNASHQGEGKGDEWADFLKKRYGPPPP
ncbi:GH-E family nuclease [Glycomyces arizonensis]|uniref:GH-E family nuclease n=1 Tax=Glycomyces arizonensis TaxID=256035 RepID=UPI0004239272|nr:GH-E family nuclease [Glycomyces arizonensis]